MGSNVDSDGFLDILTAFRPKQDEVTRSLALFSAAIAVGRTDVLNEAVALGRRYSVRRDQLYEVVLQSYLFLGFPRMLIAAEVLGEAFPDYHGNSTLQPYGSDESTAWFDNGIKLCRRVYGDSYKPLKTKVESVAPEVFRWMIVEGYGKVLSRPELAVVDRELSIVANLMIENLPKQLFSHMKGALNVGASRQLLQTVVSDIGSVAGEGYSSALAITDKLGRNG